MTIPRVSGPERSERDIHPYARPADQHRGDEART
jgi:hypothetical protein